MSPGLRKGDAVVMDNLSAHKTKAVRAAPADETGGLYLPRYSPEFNPVERCWAVVKARLAARTLDALRAAVTAALAKVRDESVERRVRHCGYRLTSGRLRHYRSLASPDLSELQALVLGA